MQGADASLMLVADAARRPHNRGARDDLSNGVSQQAILEGGGGPFGENHLEISVLTAAGAGRTYSTWVRRPRTASDEDCRALSEVRDAHRHGAAPERCAGVFGLAIGRGPNNALRLRVAVGRRHPQSRTKVVGIVLLLEIFGESGAPASIRVHLCRDATVDDLAATVEGLTLAHASVVERALSIRAACAYGVGVKRQQVTVAANAIPDGSPRKRARSVESRHDRTQAAGRAA